MNLADMMKDEGWVLGYSVNWGVKYWSFRKENLEVAMNDFNVFYAEDDEDSHHFKHWRLESLNVQSKNIKDAKLEEQE